MFHLKLPYIFSINGGRGGGLIERGLHKYLHLQRGVGLIREGGLFERGAG